MLIWLWMKPLRHTGEARRKAGALGGTGEYDDTYLYAHTYTSIHPPTHPRTHAPTHPPTHAPTPPTPPTHPPTHPRTHARTHARTHSRSYKRRSDCESSGNRYHPVLLIGGAPRLLPYSLPRASGKAISTRCTLRPMSCSRVALLVLRGNRKTANGISFRFGSRHRLFFPDSIKEATMSEATLTLRKAVLGLHTMYKLSLSMRQCEGGPTEPRRTRTRREDIFLDMHL